MPHLTSSGLPPFVPKLTDERCREITDSVDRYMRAHGADKDSAKNREYSPHMRDPRLVLRDLDIEVTPVELAAWRAIINNLLPVDSI